MAPSQHPAGGSNNARRVSDGQQQREKVDAASNVAPPPATTTTVHSSHHHLPHQPAATTRPGGSSAWPQKKIPPGEILGDRNQEKKPLARERETRQLKIGSKRHRRGFFGRTSGSGSSSVAFFSSLSPSFSLSLTHEPLLPPETTAKPQAPSSPSPRRSARAPPSECNWALRRTTGGAGQGAPAGNAREPRTPAAARGLRSLPRSPRRRSSRRSSLSSGRLPRRPQ